MQLSLIFQANQPEEEDLIAVPACSSIVTVDAVQSIIPVTTFWSVRRVERRSPHDSHSVALSVLIDQSLVPSRKLLISNLASSVGIPSAFTCVDDQVAFIRIIYVAARKDN
jgi:hypothetical protein